MRYLFCVSMFILFSCKQELGFENNCIYIVGKGNDSKNELIAKEFNIFHKQLTHIGIGIVEENELIIYEILPSTENNKVRCSEWKEFYSDDYSYLGVWKVKSDSQNINSVRRYLKKQLTSKISYDYRFDLATENELYCSELVAKTLNYLSNFNFKPNKKLLTEKHSLFLEVDTLEYYPVDFFIEHKRFIKILEL